MQSTAKHENDPQSTTIFRPQLPLLSPKLFSWISNATLRIPTKSLVIHALQTLLCPTASHQLYASCHRPSFSTRLPARTGRGTCSTRRDPFIDKRILQNVHSPSSCSSEKSLAANKATMQHHHHLHPTAPRPPPNPPPERTAQKSSIHPLPSPALTKLPPQTLTIELVTSSPSTALLIYPHDVRLHEAPPRVRKRRPTRPQYLQQFRPFRNYLTGFTQFHSPFFPPASSSRGLMSHVAQIQNFTSCPLFKSPPTSAYIETPISTFAITSMH